MLYVQHPGGSVIGFYAGKDIDASQAFNNFHLRSLKGISINPRQINNKRF
jgi:hypothetical protein